MTPQELKNSILQLAIQGRLVEQRLDEGTGEALIQQILFERNQIERNHGIKKTPRVKIDVSDIEYDIPETWGWANIDTITYSVGNKGNQILTSEIMPEGNFPVVSQGKSLIEGYTNFKDKAIYDLPLVMFGDHTRKVKYINFPFVIGADGTKFHKCILVNPKYIYYWMMYASRRLRIRGYARHYALLKEEYIPIPPLTEQKRIVAKIEEILPFIDLYEEAWTRLEDLNQGFPVDMQKSILQHAIQGKLVEQRPEEGTGEELYLQIQDEKRSLIKAGKIKKEKPLPDIMEEEKPFDIPESWKWIRLGECSSYAQRKEKIAARNITENMWSLDLEDIEKGTGRVIYKCNTLERNIVGDKVRFNKGQILYSKLRPYLKKVLVAPEDGICSSEIVPFVAYGNIDAQYFVYVLVSPYVDFMINSVTYGVKMPRVGTDTMVNLLIPLPPLAEQKRITAILYEILPLCERLK